MWTWESCRVKPRGKKKKKSFTHVCGIVAHQTDKLEIVEQQRLGQLLQLEAAVEVLAVPVRFRGRRKPLDARLL